MNNQLFSLAGQSVLVIGGSGKMGQAIAKAALAAGATVTIAGRDPKTLNRVASDLGETVKVSVGDFSDAAEALCLVSALGPIDHIVVAASGSANAGSLTHSDPSEMQKAFSRVWTSMNAAQAAAQHVSRTGSLTLISGSSGRRPVKGYGVWTAVHGAIEAVARGAALELAPIRVNVLSPGGIALRPDRQLSERSGSPDDIGQAAVALMSNPFITGAVLDVDGGERLGSWPALVP